MPTTTTTITALLALTIAASTAAQSSCAVSYRNICCDGTIRGKNAGDLSQIVCCQGDTGSPKINIASNTEPTCTAGNAVPFASLSSTQGTASSTASSSSSSSSSSDDDDDDDDSGTTRLSWTTGTQYLASSTVSNGCTALVYTSAQATAKNIDCGNGGIVSSGSSATVIGSGNGINSGMSTTGSASASTTTGSAGGASMSSVSGSQGVAPTSGVGSAAAAMALAGGMFAVAAW
ncbi:hypothetical protein CAC42_2128 [Sphaceloma murrayae]|uniref:Uncharacterized protein n=1 Tax=Sphaceloma murrayae TaxID=2082308 RepID=A0A2K1QJ29_9PEZI|nr:hypothetical protein CAC42_2128 [Sphaceloma murrayae]